MTTPYSNVSFSDVRQAEVESIRQRRRIVNLPEENAAEDMVGLALSGGDLRSSFFCLGLLQSLGKAGIWKLIDVMATVGGGGYLGSYVSSLALSGQRQVSRDDDTDEQREDSKQIRLLPTAVTPLDPWASANQYFVGLLRNGIVLCSGLIAICALIAFLWRCLDYPMVRAQANLIGVDNDAAMPFMPSIVLFALWVLAWMTSYWRVSGKTQSVVSRAFFQLAVVATLIGAVVLLGNGRITISSTIWWVLVAATIFGLMPLARPSRLVSIALHPKRATERLVFFFTVTALLLGVPLWTIGFFAREDISKFGVDPHRGLVPGDVENWELLCSLLLAEPDRSRESNSGEIVANIVNLLSPVEGSKKAGHYDLAQKLSELLEDRRQFEAKISGPWPVRTQLLARRFMDGSAGAYWKVWSEAESMKLKICNEMQSKVLSNRPFLRSVKVATRQLETNSKDAGLDQNLELARIANIGVWEGERVAELNRLALEANYPQVFRPRTRPHREAVVTADQTSRLIWLAGSLGIFILAGLWVDLNSLSLYWMYRQMIANAFVESPPGMCDVPMSQLETVSTGHPYHLLLSTIGPFIVGRDNQLDSFIFSHRYCGSDQTGYVETSHYENSLHSTSIGSDLASVAALSGCGSGPAFLRSPLLGFLAIVLNLYVGQWIPNPRQGCPRFRPRVFYHMYSWFNRTKVQSYLYAADGGYTDNVGLLALLRRRCKLVIAADASSDPLHSFTDFAQVLSVARAKYKITITSVDRDSDGTYRELELQALQPDDNSQLCRDHFVVGRIVYPGDKSSEGILVFIKPSLTGDEPIQIKQYSGGHAEFPHERLGFLEYTATSGEVYRELGHHIGQELCRRIPVVSEQREMSGGKLAAFFERLRPAVASSNSEGIVDRIGQRVEEALRGPLLGNYRGQVVAYFVDEEANIIERVMPQSSFRLVVYFSPETPKSGQSKQINFAGGEEVPEVQFRLEVDCDELLVSDPHRSIWVMPGRPSEEISFYLESPKQEVDATIYIQVLQSTRLMQTLRLPLLVGDVDTAGRESIPPTESSDAVGGTDFKAAIDLLRNESLDAKERELAVKRLANILVAGDELIASDHGQGIDQLIEVLKSDSRAQIRMAAANALGIVGAGNRQVLAALRRSAKLDRSKLTRESAGDAAARLQPKTRIRQNR